MKFKSLKTLFTLAIISSLVVTGCAKEASQTETSTAANIEVSTEATTESEVSYPIVIKHAFGETILESKPERIATISWGNQDLPLALGVVPVGVSEANYGVIDGSGLLPWTLAKFNELGVTEPVFLTM